MYRLIISCERLNKYNITFANISIRAETKTEQSAQYDTQTTRCGRNVQTLNTFMLIFINIFLIYTELKLCFIYLPPDLLQI